MGWRGRALGAAMCALGCAVPLLADARTAAQQLLAGDAGSVARRVVRSGDHGKLPFAVVDKLNARIHVFDGAGKWRGSSPVLLGQAPGDGIAPDVGLHAEQGHVPFAERTTPAGRFESQAGRNHKGEQVVWVDYDSAFAIHRLRPGASQHDRARRLASASTADKRASLGCVIVPVGFYLSVVQRLLGAGRAVVYVMPEGGSARSAAESM